MVRGVSGIQRIRRQTQIHSYPPRQPIPERRVWDRSAVSDQKNTHTHTHTYFWAKYHRITARRGPMRALVSVEHAMVIATWHMLTSGDTYRDPGPDYCTRPAPDKTKARAIHQLRSLGYKVSIESLADTA